MAAKLLAKILYFFPLLLLLANLAGKALFLTSQDIALDEPFSIYHAQFDAGTIIEQLKAYNNPPLFELILHWWTSLFGISPLAVRSLPLIFSALSPAALFYTVRRFFSVRIAVVSSLLLSASSLLVFYAHDCRVYTLFLLLSILSMHFFLALAYEADNRLKHAFCFTIASALLIYAHYFGFFILLCQALCLLFFSRRALLHFMLYYGLVLLLYLPHIYTLATRMSHSVAKGTWLQPPSGAESLYNMLWSFSNSPVVTVACILLLAAAGIKSIIQKKYRGMGAKYMLLLTWFLVPFFGMFILSYWVPMYMSRYLIFVLPAYYILLAMAIDFLFKDQLWANIAAALLVAGFILTLQPSPDKKQTAGQGVALVKQVKRTGTLVLVAPGDFLPSFAYHYNRNYFSEVSNGREYHLTDSLLKTENVYFINTAADLEHINTGLFKAVIFYDTGAEDNRRHSQVIQALEKTYRQCRQHNLNNTNSLGFFVKRQ